MLTSLTSILLCLNTKIAFFKIVNCIAVFIISLLVILMRKSIAFASISKRFVIPAFTAVRPAFVLRYCPRAHLRPRTIAVNYLFNRSVSHQLCACAPLAYSYVGNILVIAAYYYSCCFCRSLLCAYFIRNYCYLDMFLGHYYFNWMFIITTSGLGYSVFILELCVGTKYG